MCGIAGYVGYKACEKVLIECLEDLEYRGYDSSGIAVKRCGQIYVTKGKYKIKELKEKIINETKDSIGIAHTRWATHGNVTDENAHPHESQNGMWCIVHNGIIDNYLEIKNLLLSAGVVLKSTTDSEVIAQLLELNNVRSLDEFKETIDCLKGSFAILAINKFDDKIYFAKNKSPLYIGRGDSQVIFSSDIVCFDEEIQSFIILEDGEFGCVLGKNITVCDRKGINIDKNHTLNTQNKKLIAKGSYKTFMEKEINEIPEVFHNIIAEYSRNNYMLHVLDYKDFIKKIYIIGCGTAYHSGLIGAEYLKVFCGIETRVFIASEFVCSDPLIDENTLCIFISQSGETADTINAVNMVKGQCLATVVVTNSVHSTIARMVDVVLPVFAGPEIAVASTKAYNAQLLVLYLLSNYIKYGSISKKEMLRIDKNFDRVSIDDMYNMACRLLSDIELYNSIFVLGKYKDYYSALEASLKIREITYWNATPLPSGELKHGTLALVSKKSLCFIIATNKNTLTKNLSAISEIRARGGKVAIITQMDIKNVENITDYCFRLPKLDDKYIDFVSVIPFQIFALKLSEYMGYNPDKPRNLAKSVTVE